MGQSRVNIVVSNPTSIEQVLERGAILGSVEVTAAVVPLLPKREMKSKVQVADIAVLQQSEK